MRPLLLISTLTLAALSLALALPQEDEPSADEKAVHAALEDYVLGFYEAAPERLERSISKDMKKMGYWRESTESDWLGPLHMTYEQALELAGSWNEGGRQGEDLKYSIELHEVSGRTATGKLTAKWGLDYVHLAKEEGRWRIHHVIWQSVD